MLCYYQVVSLAVSSLRPLLTRVRPDQRWTAAGASILATGGFTVLVTAPALSVLAVLGIATAVAGHGAGQDRRIGQPSR
ncbi:hypothetical protein QFZ24_000113 [Streptomyces phaeochromogenes]|jgi:hypothetical protein|uniref:hypothetical protein n=1 Tax=Streptomyces phaeochromogenes TaxID=1923 RepID=UPI0027940AA0|nr:hypothetical protein [Streptomyces phaeochromogenes]MDQ0946190.1 hypothetical protein [Streptomyces phaeochromogenes]